MHCLPHDDTTQVHWREQRLATDWPGLLKQVRRWQDNAPLSWNEQDIVNGDADIARQFCRLPFDHRLFTGSTAVGHQVMHAVSDNLTPVTLELGGKSPAIIGPTARPQSGPSADFDNAAKRIVIGKTFNAGQTCIAPDYALVPRGQLSQFIESARRAVIHSTATFGGVGASGMGAYHGEGGFRTFSHFKPVFRQARVNALRWLYPPYGRVAERLLRMPRRDSETG